MSPRYVAATLARCLLTIWATSTTVFLLPYLAIGRDPRLGRLNDLAADQPIWQRYLHFLGDAVRLDFGPARIAPPARVADLIATFLPWTLALLTVATGLAFVLGLLVGSLLAWPRAPAVARWLTPLFVPLAAVPAFLFGLFLIDLVAFRLRLLPLSGPAPAGVPFVVTPAFLLELLRHATLPTLTIILTSTGFWAIATRGSVISVLGEDFMTMAEAKGLLSRRIFLTYALRNALLPQVTGFGLALGQTLSGIFLVEMIFSYPGMGLLLYRSVLAFDYNTLNGIVIVVGMAIGVAGLLLDLLYPWLDPRIRR